MFGDRTTLGRATIEDFLRDELALDDAEDFALGWAWTVTGSEGDDFEAEGRAVARMDMAAGIGATSELTEAVLAEIDRRVQIIGPNYPFESDATGIKYAPDPNRKHVYRFLCLIAARVTYDLDIPHHGPARLFEQIVSVALARLVGGTGERFGWPRMPDDPGISFTDKVTGLAKRMHLQVGPMHQIGPDAKDYGLDVIAWRGFNDNPVPGKLVVLCQCAIGRSWREKQLNVAKWQSILTFGLPLVGALAIPLVPSRQDADLHVWHDITEGGNLPLDRLRLASLISDEGVDEPLLAELDAWIDETLGALPITTA